MKLFKRNGKLVKELQGQLSSVEEKNQALLNDLQKEREERAASERALQEAKNNSRSIQDKMNQRNALHLEELEQRGQAGQNTLDEKDQQVQELKGNLLSVQGEKDTLLGALGDMIKSLILSHAQEVSTLNKKMRGLQHC
ncbi:hypothetical protein WMY93_027963 [Mugilogobius chulae]|uniref:Uncharacterized protein n=1 Tax=Mugilogobius chulae TaxID=88201 RepID=A0AAW0N3F2_9GOBI